ncbi:PadR family transcriptional regulator [Microbispora sp. NPDC046933]|uniref:PadR family transcriptional regulator n=1 Tax=Microbispora sp. NPDC046933 TaxID=3155618 RepID=UPI0033F451EE
MSGLTRVTGPLLDVLEVLLTAYVVGNGEVHGWEIMKTTKRTGPTTYGVLDRLEQAEWIVGRWEEKESEDGKPRRRYYRLTPDGFAGAQKLLTERRPGWETPHLTPKPGLALFRTSEAR